MIARRTALVVPVLLALAACAGRNDLLAVVAHPTVAELERWSWPNRDDAWRPLTEPQLLALEQLVCLLIAEAPQPSLSRAQRHRAASLATMVGVELRHASVELGGKHIELWIVSEPANDRRGRGTYLIRLGALAPEHEVELLLQAPHDRFDKHTGALALRLLLEGDAGSVRAVFINSAHRYRQLDGSRERREPSEQNPADAAHNPEHPLARTTARVLEQRELVLVQLHGFGPGDEAGEPELIVSSGRTRPNRASELTLARLRAALPEHPSGHYGVDIDRLGARQNVQGEAARAVGRCFVHLELSEQLREQLLDDRELRRRFAGALPGGTAEEFRDACR